MILHNKPPLNEKLCTFLLLITKGNITATDTIIYLLDICFPIFFTTEILIFSWDSMCYYNLNQAGQSGFLFQSLSQRKRTDASCGPSHLPFSVLDKN